MVKNSPANAGDTGDAGSIPGSGIFPGEGNGNPLQQSCLGKPVDRGALCATVHGVAKCWTGLRTHTLLYSVFPAIINFKCLYNPMSFVSTPNQSLGCLGTLKTP